MTQMPATRHVPCPLCGGDARFVFAVGDRFYRVTDYIANVFRCGSCHTRFQWPVPDRETISEFYPSGYWRESETKSLMATLQAFYVRCLLRWDPLAWVKRLNLPRGARIIDVGCSRGDWLNETRKLGYRVQGIEADPRAAAYARDHYLLDVEEVDAESWSPQPKSADAILFFHLLEHLINPELFLSKCFSALKPGGKILCRVPNMTSWQASWMGPRWKGLEMPRHIHLFTPESLSKLLSDNGFQVLTTSSWSWRDGPPALTSSLFPAGEPTRQAILNTGSPLKTLTYLGLNWMMTPFEMIAAGFGRGGMLTVIANRPADNQSKSSLTEN